MSSSVDVSHRVTDTKPSSLKRGNSTQIDGFNKIKDKIVHIDSADDDLATPETRASAAMVLPNYPGIFQFQHQRA